MFTGIVEELGKIKSISKSDDLWKLYVITSSNINNSNIGDSISINGVCLTIVIKDENVITFDIVKETLDVTNLSLLNVNDYVNVERAMKINDRIDGHMVQGHVENVAKIILKESKKMKLN